MTDTPSHIRPLGGSTSRRGFILTGLAAGAGAGLCTLGAAPAIAQDGQGLRFTHIYGETVLPAPAQRIVSLGYNTQDPLLALGVVPVATREWFGNFPHAVWPWAQPLLGGAEPVVLTAESSPEIIAVLAPDLIVGIGSGISEAEYRLLSQIAPVLMQPPEDDGYAMPWDRLTLLLGRATGRQEQAGKLVDGLRETFRAARERRPDWAGKTAVAAYSYGGDVGAYIGSDTRVEFLSELGFVSPPDLATAGRPQGFYTSLSPEDLGALDADLLVWVVASAQASDIARLPMRKQLRAYGEGREVFTGDLLAGALSFGSVLSLPFALGLIEPEIVAALDGRADTQVAGTLEAGLAP